LRNDRAQLVPLLARDAPERRHHLRVELPPRELFQLGDRHFVRASRAIDAVARDRVEGVGDGEDARVEVDLFGAQAARVTRPVPLLVVLPDDARRPFQKFDALQNLLAVHGVTAHVHPFLRAELRGLVQDGVRHADLADVVQERAELQRAQILARQIQLAPQTQAETDDALRVAVRLAVARLQRGGEGFQSHAVRFFERGERAVEFRRALGHHSSR
jgi:hypothetical protein